MREKNLYLATLKERYLSLIVIPILAISGIEYYYHFISRGLTGEDLVFAILVIGTLLIQSILIISSLIKMKFLDVFTHAIRLIVIVLILRIWGYYFPGVNLGHEYERFEVKKAFYVHEAAIRPSIDTDGKGKLVEFNLKPGPAVWRGIVYDETDTLADTTTKHRGLGENFLPDDIKVIKLEPKFYYVQRFYEYDIESDVKNIEE